MPRRTLLLALAASGTWANTGHPESCPDINPIGCAAMTVPPEWHDVSLYFGELRLHAAYGIADWLAADLLWSLRVVVQRFQLEDLATRRPVAAPFGEELHHRSETLVGLTDPWLSLRAGERLGAWSFVFRAGMTLPVGGTVPNPFDLGRAGKAHEHLQFGTGTVDPFVEVETRRAFEHFLASGSLLAKAALYPNSHGYQAGAQLLAGAHLSSDLWTKRWTFTLGATIYNEQPERWNGIQETEGNLGRTDFLIDGAVSVKLPREVSLGLSTRVPAYSIARGEQLATPAIFELSVTRPFKL